MGNEHITKKDFQDFEKRQNVRFEKIESHLNELENKAIDTREADVLHKKWRDADTRMHGMEISTERRMSDLRIFVTDQVGLVKKDIAVEFTSMRKDFDTKVERITDAVSGNKVDIAKLMAGFAIVNALVIFLLNRFS